MRNIVCYILAGLVLTGFLSCKKPFSAQLTSVATNFLAVDGPIISGDTTFITLSRSTSLSDTTQNKAELKAIISVEDDQAKLYPLTEKGKGQYFLPTTNFDLARKYRLDIKTKDGKIYQSDFVPMKVTGPIDSIYFQTNGYLNVGFYLDAHDPTNNTRYYRWDYQEVWQYNSYYEAIYKYINGQVVNINDANYLKNDTYYCYRHDYSNQIFIGSSSNLSQDVIKRQQLSSVPDTSEKISQIYALVVHQYALTEDGFKYYQNLKTNTEQLGSIFDAQPSSLTGNIHCISSPTDIVIGFASVSTVSQKTTAFRYSQLGVLKIGLATNAYQVELNNNNAFYYGTPTADQCGSNLLYNAPASTFSARAAKALGLGDSLVFAPPRNNNTIGFLYAPKNCVDCSYKGGTKTRPSYFPPPY